MLHRVALPTAVVLALACLAPAATTLKPNVTTGLAYSFDNSMKLDLNLGLNAGGQQMTMQQAIAQTAAGSIEVLEASGGKISKARITFGPKCGATATMFGQTQTKPFPLAGKTVVATVKGENVEIEGGTGLDAETQKAVKELVTSDDGFYPAKPVEVGEQWTGSLGSGEMRSKVTFKLERIAHVGGRDVAEMSAAGEMSGIENGMNMTGTISGPVAMDVESGLITTAQVGGDMKIDGNMTEGGQQVVVNGTGKMSVGTKNSITSVSGVNPTPPVPPAPIVVGGEAPPLAGTYVGDGLTITLNGSDVQLQLSTNQFAGKIDQVTAGNVAGSFTHQGKRFDFKCVVNGDSVEFTTGSKTYRLKKQASDNPLD